MEYEDGPRYVDAGWPLVHLDISQGLAPGADVGAAVSGRVAVFAQYI
jgi:hypothetical protein